MYRYTSRMIGDWPMYSRTFLSHLGRLSYNLINCHTLYTVRYRGSSFKTKCTDSEVSSKGSCNSKYIKHFLIIMTVFPIFNFLNLKKNYFWHRSLGGLKLLNESSFISAATTYNLKKISFGNRRRCQPSAIRSRNQ